MGFKLAELLISVGTTGENGVFSTLKSIQNTLLGLPIASQIVSTGISTITGMVQDAEQAFRESVAAGKILDSVLRATGEAAGFGGDELRGMAGDLQKVTNFSDEDALSGMTKLLTFKSIKGDVFKEATEMAMNMSELFGGDLSSNAIKLGKALESPAMGLNALRKFGVSFTQAERDKIKELEKSGKLHEAQGLILAAMKNQGLNNTARDMASPIKMMQNQIGEVAEAIGAGIVPVMNTIRELFLGWIPDSDKLKEKMAEIGGTIGGWITSVKPGFDALGEAFRVMVDLAADIGTAIVNGIGPAAEGIGISITSWKEAFISAGEGVAYFMHFIQDEWPTITAMFTAGMEYIAEVIAGRSKWAWDNFGALAVSSLAGITAGVTKLAEIIVSVSVTAIKTVFDYVTDNNHVVSNALAKAFGSGILDATMAAGQAWFDYWKGMIESVGLLMAGNLTGAVRLEAETEAKAKGFLNNDRAAGGVAASVADTVAAATRAIQEGMKQGGIGDAFTAAFNSAYKAIGGKDYKPGFNEDMAAEKLGDLFESLKNKFVGPGAPNGVMPEGWDGANVDEFVLIPGQGKGGEGDGLAGSGKAEFFGISAFAKHLQTSMAAKNKDAEIADHTRDAAGELAKAGPKQDKMLEHLAAIERKVGNFGFVGAMIAVCLMW